MGGLFPSPSGHFKMKNQLSVPSIYIVVLDLGYLAAELGILMVWKGPKKQMAEGFKNDCISFCKAIESFGKLLGKQLVKPEKWRKLHQDYDKHLEIFGVKLS